MGEINEEDKEAIAYAKELINLYRYGMPLSYTDDDNELLKKLLGIIEKQEKTINNLKRKCTDKEWKYCRVEKMGCEGCHYYKKEG